MFQVYREGFRGSRRVLDSSLQPDLTFCILAYSPGRVVATSKISIFPGHLL